MSQIKIVKGSVVYAKTDALVNAANSSLLGGGGVDGAIHAAAGEELFKECLKLNGCKTGEAKITKAYNIKNAKYIIHTVGPIYGLDSRPEKLLESCYINCLELAKANGCKSIAFCGISVGVYSYPLQEATKIALSTTKKWLKDNEMDVYFYCFTQHEFDVYTQIFNNL